MKPGKGSAFVRTKIKNLRNGNVLEKTFRAGESVTAADVQKTEMQYTYSDGDNICFMNMETFEEQIVPRKVIEQMQLLKEGLSCQVSIFNEEVIDVTLPNTVEYTVVECPPNFRGDSGTNVQKPATIDSGATVNVPMFIEPGEKILVSTEDCKYISRA